MNSTPTRAYCPTCRTELRPVSPWTKMAVCDCIYAGDRATWGGGGWEWTETGWYRIRDRIAADAQEARQASGFLSVGECIDGGGR